MSNHAARHLGPFPHFDSIDDSTVTVMGSLLPDALPHHMALATLPCRMGGLGTRLIAPIAPIAYLAAYCDALYLAPLFGSLENLAPHPQRFFDLFDAQPQDVQAVIAPFAPLCPTGLPRKSTTDTTKLQKKATAVHMVHRLDALKTAPNTAAYFNDDLVIRKMKSASGKGASAWLLNPSPRDPLIEHFWLSDEFFALSSRFRLHMDQSTLPTCCPADNCLFVVTPTSCSMEYHLLSCMRTGLREEAHSGLKRGLAYLMAEAGMSVQNEPTLPGKNIRCDIGSHHGGKNLIIDVALTHPLRRTFRRLPPRAGGACADAYALETKLKTYDYLLHEEHEGIYSVVPFVIELLGAQGKDAAEFLKIIVTRLAAVHGLSIASASQIANARVSIMTQLAVCHCLKAATRRQETHFGRGYTSNVRPNVWQAGVATQEAWDRIWRQNGGVNNFTDGIEASDDEHSDTASDSSARFYGPSDSDSDHGAPSTHSPEDQDPAIQVMPSAPSSTGLHPVTSTPGNASSAPIPASTTPINLTCSAPGNVSASGSATTQSQANSAHSVPFQPSTPGNASSAPIPASTTPINLTCSAPGNVSASGSATTQSQANSAHSVPFQPSTPGNASSAPIPASTTPTFKSTCSAPGNVSASGSANTQPQVNSAHSVPFQPSTPGNASSAPIPASTTPTFKSTCSAPGNVSASGSATTPPHVNSAHSVPFQPSTPGNASSAPIPASTTPTFKSTCSAPGNVPASGSATTHSQVNSAHSVPFQPSTPVPSQFDDPSGCFTMSNTPSISGLAIHPSEDFNSQATLDVRASPQPRSSQASQSPPPRSDNMASDSLSRGSASSGLPQMPSTHFCATDPRSFQPPPLQTLGSSTSLSSSASTANRDLVSAASSLLRSAQGWFRASTSSDGADPRPHPAAPINDPGPGSNLKRSDTPTNAPEPMQHTPPTSAAAPGRISWHQSTASTNNDTSRPGFAPVASPRPLLQRAGSHDSSSDTDDEFASTTSSGDPAPRQ